jgi:large subunit ribosomal protein L4
MGLEMQVPVYNTEGQEIDQIEVDETVFGVEPNNVVVHQALVRQLANARVGTVETKRRGEVSGSTRKLFRQKHTGFARAGSRRSPTRRGGGVAFGPHARCHRQAMPKKMRRLALRSVLSSKAADGDLKVIDGFGLVQPKTSDMVDILDALGVKSSALLVTAEPDANVVKSARNLERTRTQHANTLNVGDLLSHQVLLVTVDAVRRIEEVWGCKGSPVEEKES